MKYDSKEARENVHLELSFQGSLKPKGACNPKGSLKSTVSL